MRCPPLYLPAHVRDHLDDVIARGAIRHALQQAEVADEPQHDMLLLQRYMLAGIQTRDVQ
jgi:hypothetical protein